MKPGYSVCLFPFHHNSYWFNSQAHSWKLRLFFKLNMFVVLMMSCVRLIWNWVFIYNELVSWMWSYIQLRNKVHQMNSPNEFTTSDDIWKCLVRIHMFNQTQHLLLWNIWLFHIKEKWNAKVKFLLVYFISIIILILMGILVPGVLVWHVSIHTFPKSYDFCAFSTKYWDPEICGISEMYTFENTVNIHQF